MQTITFDDTMYQLVPKEPTAEMKIAGDNAGWWCADKYRAMLSAAPTPPAQPAERKPLTEEQAYAISAPIFSGGNRHPRAELELIRATEAAHGITAPKPQEFNPGLCLDSGEFIPAEELNKAND